MMTKYLLAIDPGWATGASLWRVPEDEPIERMAYWLIDGGPDAFEEWWQSETWNVDEKGFYVVDDLEIVCEKFVQDGRTPRVDPNALLIEGFLRGAWGKDYITWQRNSAKTTVGDKLLKQHGFWLTGKQVKWTDGRDVNDSQLHGLHWAMNNHRPSLEYFWPKGK